MEDLDLCSRIRRLVDPMRVSEAARVTGVSDDTIYRAIQRGELKALRFARVIRIDPFQLARFVELHLVGNETRNQINGENSEDKQNGEM